MKNLNEICAIAFKNVTQFKLFFFFLFFCFLFYCCHLRFYDFTSLRIFFQSKCKYFCVWRLFLQSSFRLGLTMTPPHILEILLCALLNQCDFVVNSEMILLMKNKKKSFSFTIYRQNENFLNACRLSYKLQTRYV